MARQLRQKMGNKAKARQCAHNQKTGKYVRQRVRTEANKLKRRKKHLLKHPNDSQSNEIYQEIYGLSII